MFYILKHEDKFCICTENMRTIRVKDPMNLIWCPIAHMRRLDDEFKHGYTIIYESKKEISKKELQKIKDRYIEYFL